MPAALLTANKSKLAAIVYGLASAKTFADACTAPTSPQNWVVATQAYVNASKAAAEDLYDDAPTSTPAFVDDQFVTDAETLQTAINTAESNSNNLTAPDPQYAQCQNTLDGVKTLIAEFVTELNDLEGDDPFDSATILRDLAEIADWDEVIGPTPTTTADADAEDDSTNGADIRIYYLDEETERVRMEIQAHGTPPAAGSQPIPGEYVYQYEMYIPSSCDIDEDQQGLTGGATVMQTHTDVTGPEGGGYSGGHALNSDDELLVRVTGNKSQGEDEVFTIGTITRDEWFWVVERVYWDEDTDGWIKVWFNGELTVDESSIVTCPDGATKQKFRLGWYADPCNGLDMYVRNAKIYEV